jgi:hypothetical protein
MRVRVDAWPVAFGPGADRAQQRRNRSTIDSLLRTAQPPAEAGPMRKALLDMEAQVTNLEAALVARRQASDALTPEERQAEEAQLAQATADVAVKRRRFDMTRQLFDQVAALNRRGASHARNDPHALPARLAVLAHLLEPTLGMKVVFGCADGHGLSGELDVEIKHLRLQMELAGRVPAPGATRTSEEQRHFAEMLANGGNAELRRLNTGWTD